ncbi:putative fimbrial chaperone YfcS [Vibrio jasicida]|uniref:fimbrial biogenesis chaperone n=1 Tax=Vibrio jasicida TaxID=766224 RepID=UPI002895F1AB|nr:putative fimbrial chaperone YfcS [Vibrio jasicida]
MKKERILAILITSLISTSAFSAISLDRTRAIFDASKKSISLNISNDNKHLPYLAQAWVEDAEHNKISQGPLIATPLVQRVEPNSKSTIRISTIPNVKELPNDRESIFYFNLREIPPKSEKANVLQIALQTKIKLFYRPNSIRALPNAEWQRELIIKKEGKELKIENPTPYYVTIIGLGSTIKGTKEDKFEPKMIKPFSFEMFNQSRLSRGDIYLAYVNDYGGTPLIKFKCDNTQCLAEKKN